MKKALLVLLCTATTLSAYAAETEVSAANEMISFNLDTIWVLLSAALVFFMQAGFKCLEVGLVRKHQIAAVAMKNMVDWTVGFNYFLSAGLRVDVRPLGGRLVRHRYVLALYLLGGRWERPGCCIFYVPIGFCRYGPHHRIRFHVGANRLYPVPHRLGIYCTAYLPGVWALGMGQCVLR